MCNPMTTPTSELIYSVIDKNSGEKKHLDEWVGMFNKTLPKQKRITRRSVTHIIAYAVKNHNIIIKKEVVNKHIYYEFDKV